MPLWGIQEVTGSNTGTIQIFANGLVTGTGTDFDNEISVNNFLRCNDVEYRVTAITNATSITVEPATISTSTVTTQNSGSDFTISEKPISFALIDSTLNANQVVFVDTTEVADSNNISKGLYGTGWVRWKTWTTAKGVVRYAPEIMVATKATRAQAGDAENDIAET